MSVYHDNGYVWSLLNRSAWFWLVWDLLLPVHR